MKKYIHVSLENNIKISEPIMVFSTRTSWAYQWRNNLEILDKNNKNTDWIKIEYTKRLRYRLKRYFKFSKNWYITSKEFFSYVKTNKNGQIV